MRIVEDENRVIKILVLNDGKQIAGEPYRSIKPYEENGEMSKVTWFEVQSSKNGIEQRVNAAHVRQVIYT